MQNPWLEIPLSDYEAHMDLPAVDQASMTASELSCALSLFTPASLAVIGCAGGNGFDAIPPSVRRVVGVDINPRYAASAGERYAGQVAGLEFHVADIQRDPLQFEPVDLLFASLVFEYVAIGDALVNLARVCRPGGRMVTLLQQPSPTLSSLTPSPYDSIRLLSPLMRLVPPAELAGEAASAGFGLVFEKSLTIRSGKSFVVQHYCRDEDARSAAMCR
ncbi:class I SAM-dependent methyltransferase [Chlorobium sp. N1]|uniref:class I SAM-dependent methyltransferase n=1 Tax=Chlorobium sp. N1 TaxID=2491138 RepID=UPI00103C737C|nr:class I SAM-dependent methyltransferase [Chlorobium sp. N1]TCD47117.1 class I SAM-dependent methyltransferase [Chlorobium sp. N1]